MITNPFTTKVEIKHSESKSAWNLVGTMPGGKYKIARIPYCTLNNEDCDKYNQRSRKNAHTTARYLMNAINNHRQL